VTFNPSLELTVCLQQVLLYFNYLNAFSVNAEQKYVNDVKNNADIVALILTPNVNRTLSLTPGNNIRMNDNSAATANIIV